MKSTLRRLDAQQLTIDPEIQRDLVLRQVNAMTGDKYNPDALGTLVVSRRSNGTYVILDGQHRWNVVKLMDPFRQLDCLVYEDLTREDEAELFLTYNNQSGVNAMSRFKAAVTAGRALPVAVKGIFDKYGLVVNTTQQGVSAVGDCLRVAHWPKGLELLDHSLDILTSAWSTLRNDIRGEVLADLSVARGNRPYRGTIIVGMARVINRYGTDLRDADMVRALLEKGSRCPEIIARDADALRGAMGRMAADEATAMVLVRIHNSRHGGRRLEKWDSDIKDENTHMRPTFNDLVSAGTSITDEASAE